MRHAGTALIARVLPVHEHTCDNPSLPLLQELLDAVYEGWRRRLETYSDALVVEGRIFPPPRETLVEMVDEAIDDAIKRKGLVGEEAARYKVELTTMLAWDIDGIVKTQS